MWPNYMADYVVEAEKAIYSLTRSRNELNKLLIVMAGHFC